LLIFYRPLLSLYHQQQAGASLRAVIPVGDNDYGGFACLRPFIEDLNERDLLLNAATHLRKAEALDPRQAYTFYLLGKTYCLLGDYENAIAAFQRFGELRPRNPAGYLEMGFALLQVCPPNGKCADGLNTYDTWRWAGVRAEDFIPIAERAREKEDYETALLWYQNAQRMGLELRSTIAYLRYLHLRANGDLDNANKALQSAIQMDQGWVDVQMRFNSYYLIGKLYTDQREWKSAEKIYRKMIFDYAESDSYRSRLPELYRQLGYVLTNIALQTGKWDRLEDARQSYLSSWKLDLKSGTLPLVNFLINNQEDVVAAEDVLRQSIARSPDEDSWLAWNNRLGEILRREKRWDESIAIYEGILKRNPQYWMAYIGLGWAKYERGDGLVAALNEFQKVIEILVSKGNGEYAIAQVLVREKQFQEAEKWFVKALNLNPEARLWWVERANAMRISGELSRAIDIYLISIEKFPDFPALYYEIAWAYKLNSQLPEAVMYIEKAIELIPQPNLWFYLRAGIIYEESAQNDKALQAYKLALRIDPANEIALKGVERLGN
jgi:tetratricopeptide (TPR) repeat protein